MAEDKWKLVSLLKSGDFSVCNAAAKEILGRGEAMINPLLQQQGNTTSYAGTLGNSQGSTATIVPLAGSELKPEQRDKVVTVEVAALYLISAIYYGRLDFSSSALLSDLTVDPINRRATNKKEYITRGFQSAREWAEACRRHSLAELRAKHEDPLKRAKLAWW